jgi:hypothetical protein
MDTLFRLFCQHLRTISFHACNLFSSIRYSDSTFRSTVQAPATEQGSTLDTDTGLIIRKPPANNTFSTTWKKAY